MALEKASFFAWGSTRRQVRAGSIRIEARAAGRNAAPERCWPALRLPWFGTDKSKYALSYNHEAGAIELREKSVRGTVLASLTNKTGLNALRTLFEGL